MGEYTYEVVSLEDNYSWGLFKTKYVAGVLAKSLKERFPETTFKVKVIK